MPYTLGFRNSMTLGMHYYKHRHEFNPPPANQQEYEEWADRFLGGPLDATTSECERLSDHAIIRYSGITEEFGILESTRFIKTYFIAKIANHKFANNREYYEEECAS